MMKGKGLMKSVRWWSTVGAAALVVSGIGAAGGIPAATAAPSGRAQLQGSAAPASARSRPQGQVAASSSVSFDAILTLRDAQGAQRAATAISTPGSAQFHHFLTLGQWEAQYGPTQAEVSATKSWLRHQGFTVGAVPADRLFVPAQGTAAQVERAFATTLGNFQVNGKTVREATTPLSIPSSLASVISGVVGVNQHLMTPDLATEPPPPAAFANPQPCSAWWGQRLDTADKASLDAPYAHPLPYDICGYLPAQLRAAYNIPLKTGGVLSGTGVSLAIVDAYDAPTILTDAQHYFKLNDNTNLLATGQFQDTPPTTTDPTTFGPCGGSGWAAEESLDVESSHAMAPGATIKYFGAQDCFDINLFNTENTAITSGASVVSNSWGDTLGDLLVDASEKNAFDATFQMAAGTGVSVLFSSGDSGDNFADFGLATPDYPASSPFITTVGGTALEVSSVGQRTAEFGWSTAKRVLCASKTTNCGTATKPAGALLFNAGGGGGTSYTYLQPKYQKGVVPNALALRNQAIFGPTPLRVEPDIAMDADAQTGMLIGLTETFPGGSPNPRYGQFKEGGTSLASPLLAGVVADAVQLGGGPMGLLNPILYSSTFRSPTTAAIRDIMPPAAPLTAATNRVDFANTVNASSGFVVSLRVLDYQGPETYCDGTGNCATRLVTLKTAKGFDSMTGLGSPGRNFRTELAALGK
jgi:subtilase family serine protease